MVYAIEESTSEWVCEWVSDTGDQQRNTSTILYISNSDSDCDEDEDCDGSVKSSIPGVLSPDITTMADEWVGADKRSKYGNKYSNESSS